MDLALRALEHEVRPPQHRLASLGAFEELLVQSAPFHAVQGGHFSENLGADGEQLFERWIHELYLCTIIHNYSKPINCPKAKIRLFKKR